MKKTRKKKIILLTAFILAFLCFAFITVKFKHKLSQKKGPLSLVEQVSKLIELPENQTPILGTVNDKEKIKNQPFFARAENGDKILIFSESGKVILYRPSKNKIVEVSFLKTEK